VPEGHTIHRLAREHTRLLKGQALAVSSPQGRFEAGAARLSGRVLRRVEPYGKHLWYHFAGEPDPLHVHLGLYGKFTASPLPPPEPRGALRLRMMSAEVAVDLRGPTACDLTTPAERLQVLARLGPDPLAARPDGTAGWLRVTRSRAPIGVLLMDQSVLAGVGNVYRAEVLFRQVISPFRPGRELREDEWVALWDDLVLLMRAGVRSGRIVTTRPADRARRSGRPTRDDSFYVYRRQGLPCRLCGAEVRTEEMGGRNLFWCPHDQCR